MEIRHVGVIGAGTMGNGIAQVCATAGLRVTMVDVADAALQRGMASLTASLDRMAKKGKLSEAEKQATLSRITTTTSYDALRGVDLVIEAATENPELKLRILRQIDETVGEQAIVATNFRRSPSRSSPRC